MRKVFNGRLFGRFTQIKNNLRRKKRQSNSSEWITAPISLKKVLVIETKNFNPIQMKKDSLNILRDHFSSRRINFHINSIPVIMSSRTNETSTVFPTLKSTRNFLLQSTVSHTSNSRLESNSSCWHKIRCLIRLWVESSIISKGSNITDKNMKKVINQ